MNQLKLLSKFAKHVVLKNNIQLQKMSLTTSNINTVPPLEDFSQRIVWVDMELTGLDFHTDKILEIACIITEADLNIVAQAPLLIVHQSEEILNNMHEWCLKQHGKTGLIEESLNSKLSVEEADQLLYDFVVKYTPPGKCCLAGNSVYADRWHMMKYLPKFNSHLHYRLIDVSSVKELCKRWRKDIVVGIPEKDYVHRATEDILESIEELKHYKKVLFQ